MERKQMTPDPLAAIQVPTVRVPPFDPPAELVSLRESGSLCPMHYADGKVGWLVTRYAQARGLLADRRFGVGPMDPAAGNPATHAAIRDAIGELDAGFVSSKNAPDHTRLRRIVADRFMPRRVGELRESIERIVEQRLDAMEQAGPPIDLRAEFALPIPSHVICELLGVPISEERHFLRPTDVVLDSRSTPEQATAAFGEFNEYVREVVRRKRAEPVDDLLSDLIQGGELSDGEIAGMAMELFITGHETTACAIAVGALALLRDRDGWDALCADAHLLEAGVDELLRYLTIVEESFTRIALEDTELDGVPVAAGDRLTISLLAANRDPDAFADEGRLDFGRDARGHLAFGHGIHKCLGQHLARLELQLALGGLSRRFPALRLAVAIEDVPLVSAEVGVFRAMELPVTW
jgi:cytochrome P450